MVRLSHGEVILEDADETLYLPDGTWRPVVVHLENCSRCHRLDSLTYCDWYDHIVCVRCHKYSEHDCYHREGEIDVLAAGFDQWVTTPR